MPRLSNSREYWQREVRKELGRRSIKAFCLLYLRHHFPKPFAENHEDLFQKIDDPKKNKRVVRAEPRRFGKTSLISLALPLQALAYQTKWFVLLVGEAAPSAESNLQSIIDEVENNELLLQDFPHLAPKRDNKGQLVKWTDRQLVFESGATIVAKGTGARLRGLKRERFRPDLAILDDPESPETADTFGKRKRHKNWFGGTFMGLGASEWDIYVIGNLIHLDCLIADLLKSPEWDAKVYRAENTPTRKSYPFPLGNTKQDGSALWPEAWPLEELAQYKRQPTVGTIIYAHEMMNDPMEDSDRKFDTGQFAYFDFTPQMLGEYDVIATFIDPAGGQKPNEIKQGKKDFAAIVTAGRRKDNRKVQIIDARLTRDLPAKQIDLLLDVYQEFRPSRMAAEDNIFKNLIRPNIEQRAQTRGMYPPIVSIHQTQNKVTRVLSIQPPIEAKTIEFARHLLKTCPEFFEQFDEFPGGHDDGPDATEGAVRLTEYATSWRPVV